MGKVEQMQATPAHGEPDKLATEARRIGFDEAYLPFRANQTQRGALHCLKCGERSVCEWTYPLHNHISQWIELVRVGNIDATVELSHQISTLPEVTGRICPQDRLCEGACTIRNGHDAVTISNIERHISDQTLAKSWRPDLSHVIKVDKRVVIIGAGPAGLACVNVLTHNGIEVTVYDHHPEIGGLLAFGIPSFKLDRSLLARRREIFSVAGVHFELNCEVGKDVSSNSPLEQHDAVFVGTGTYRSMKTGLPSEDVPGVYGTLPFLTANTKQVIGLEELPEEPFINTAGLSVTILGSDNTAVDRMRTALRHSASSVTCAYRCGEANMPGSREEVKNACGEGASFEFNVQPVVLELNRQDHVCGVRLLRTRLDEPDAQGRRRPVPVEGSGSVVPVDAMIMAFGFNPHGMPWLESHGVTVGKWGRIIADMESQYHYQTINPKIFVGGDAVCDADLVVTAMAEGRHVAQGIID